MKKVGMHHPREAAVLGLLLGLVGCEGRDTVAKVGSQRLSRADVSLYSASHRDVAPEQAVEALVERTLLAEGARRAGLLDDAEVRARVESARRDILANAYLDKVAGEGASPEALQQRYEAERERLTHRQVHVAHILVRVPPGADARTRTEARARINALYARLVGGEDFAAVARAESEDAETGRQGGDVGPMREGEVETRFFAAVAELKQGELSKPFETAFGLHVARALEGPRSEVPPFQEVRGLLAAQARAEAEERLMKQLSEDITVKRYPEHLAVQGGQDQSQGGESQ